VAFRSALPGSACIVVLLMAASPCASQTRLTSLDDLRRELAAGDVVTIVPATGAPVVGRVVRLGTIDLDVQNLGKRPPRASAPLQTTILFSAIRSVERRRDPVRNGTVLGAAVGAGFGAGMFLTALATDRNELDEWAPIYAGFAAISTGAGALIGWRIDAAKSKPHIRFDASSGARPMVSVRLMLSRGLGIRLTASF
jgi:hypothetical protein